MSALGDALRLIAGQVDDNDTAHAQAIAARDATIADQNARIAELEAQQKPDVDVLTLTELTNLSHGPTPRPDGKRDYDGTPFAAHDAIPRGKKRDWLIGATNNVRAFPVKRTYNGAVVEYDSINNWYETFPIPGGMSPDARTARQFFTPGTVLFWHPDGPHEWVDVTPKKAPVFNGYLWTGMAEKYDNAPNSKLAFRNEGGGVFSFPLAGTTNPDGTPFDDRNPAHWYNPGQYSSKLQVPAGTAVCVLGYGWLGHDNPKADLSSAKFVHCLSADLFEGPDGGAQPGEEHKHYGTGKPRLVRMTTTPALVGTLRGWPASRFGELPPVPRPPVPTL